MVRTHMENIPQYPFPEGYGIRPMRLDEGGLWTDIWNDAESDDPVMTGFSIGNSVTITRQQRGGAFSSPTPADWR